MQTEPTTNNAHRVLVTGAAGRIGSYFAQHNHDRYRLRLMARGDEPNIDDLPAWGEVVCGQLGDLEAMKRFAQGIDTIVHMAGNPAPNAEWQDLLDANIVGTYHVFAAAKAMGVKRVVYASSIHAVSGYAADVQVKTNEPVNPGDLYGVSKCFGEALARYMAEQEGVSAIAIRIGGFQPTQTVQQDGGISLLDDWVSERDLNQLIQKCIEAQNIKYATLHGLSNNRFKRLDISDARELVGYQPQDDSARELPQLRDVPLQDMETASVRDPGMNSGLRHDVEPSPAPPEDAPAEVCAPVPASV